MNMNCFFIEKYNKIKSNHKRKSINKTNFEQKIWKKNFLFCEFVSNFFFINFHHHHYAEYKKANIWIMSWFKMSWFSKSVHWLVHIFFFSFFSFVVWCVMTHRGKNQLFCLVQQQHSNNKNITSDGKEVKRMKHTICDHKTYTVWFKNERECMMYLYIAIAKIEWIIIWLWCCFFAVAFCCCCHHRLVRHSFNFSYVYFLLFILFVFWFIYALITNVVCRQTVVKFV